MALLGHFTQIAVPAALDQMKFGAGNLRRQHSRRGDMIAGATFVSVFAADDHQSRRLDVVNQVSRLMALARHDMAQVAF